MKHLLFALVLVLSACGPVEPEVFVDSDAPPGSFAYAEEVTLDGTYLTRSWAIGCEGNFEVRLRESAGTHITAEKTCGDHILTLVGFIPDTRATIHLTIITQRVGENITVWEFNGRAL